MTRPPKRPWSPSPLIAGSAAIHLAAGAAVLVRPVIWPWALGLVVADHLALTSAGLWPKSKLLGPNWTRLPAAAAARGGVAITIDDGPDPQVTPRVLSILKERGASATFFCIGERLQRYPDLAREIHACGHAIENHSYRHTHTFALLGPNSIAAEIGRAQDCIEEITGVAPGFFRAPAGLRNAFLEPALTRLQLRLASWTRRGFDTVDRDSTAVLRRLTHTLDRGDILLLHDGNAARMRGGGRVILEVLPRLLDALGERRLRPMTLRAALE